MFTSILKVTWPLAVVVSLSAASCEQPNVKCQTQRGNFAVRYTLVSGDPNSVCGKLTGETVGINTYNAPRDDGLWDNDRPSLAIQSSTMMALRRRVERANLKDPEESHKLYAYGVFTSGDPDGQDFCYVPQLQEAYQALPEAPAIPDSDPTDTKDDSVPAQPETRIRYRWSNMKLYNTPEFSGSMFAADLELMRDDCTATYRAWGLYGSPSCQSDAGCKAQINEAEGIVTVPPVNPKLALICELSTHQCVLDKEPPALK